MIRNWRTFRKTDCYWVEQYVMLGCFACYVTALRYVNKILLLYVISIRGKAALRAKARGLPRAKAKPRPCDRARVSKPWRAAKPRHVAAKPRAAKLRII